MTGEWPLLYERNIFKAVKCPTVNAHIGESATEVGGVARGAQPSLHERTVARHVKGMRHVEGVSDQFDDIFHGLVAVNIYTLFSTADEILLEMAKN